jgi:hypothetical protein
VASNQQNKGVKPYFMALHRGFNATLKEVDFEAEVRLIFFFQKLFCNILQNSSALLLDAMRDLYCRIFTTGLIICFSY